MTTHRAYRPDLISRKELKLLMRRSNRAGFQQLAGFCLVLGATTSMVITAFDSVWLIPAMLLQGIVLVHLFAIQHECAHLTAFRTRWINHLIGGLCGLAIGVAPLFFRYEHTDHHTYTQSMTRDPERIPLPATIGQYLRYLSALPYWFAQFSGMLSHSFGIISAEEKRFIPASERWKIIWEARSMLAFYALAVLYAITVDGIIPLFCWWLPLVLAEPMMRFIRMTEHVGKPSVPDLTRNTRSNRTFRALRFLCWNMNYHAEHHFASSVPFHALPALHRKLAAHLPVTGGYFSAHRDILAQIRAKKNVLR